MSKPTGSSDRLRVVSATEAAKNFGEVLARVREERAVYVVERRGKPVAEIRPVEERAFTGADFLELVRATSDPSAGPEYACAVETGIAFLNRAEVPKSPWER
ncbi:MAG: type II toxin-antitoxin system Phd/YefM family antitoxin [Gemmatimonadetes bacterium]|nr:type II toxin-antitoxin system Phd/YefM family antitoxin [Gemmatimonadota bacterium]MXX33991.1 type II toxin-antitoxin system Phd/YefM family antitoxin [Gemmatimonadota bacterium]MYA12816.1 type II toxin-antitoxin system Phd/YefM family antitoxin [Gemmatimonadota bacterium]MYD12294.1 type II toxin-antitoxin system Phd/YefM family antitoxin [Gemmatimonadota bacterium]MYE69791.1 type II toxin-antitoxin system Phd/YefM family antitoxin [Gemmatimonadota bacterium]